MLGASLPSAGGRGIEKISPCVGCLDVAEGVEDRTSIKGGWTMD